MTLFTILYWSGVAATGLALGAATVGAMRRMGGDG